MIFSRIAGSVSRSARSGFRHETEFCVNGGRRFCTESPEKRNYDIKEIPQAQEQKSESDDSRSDFLREYFIFTFIYYLHEDYMEKVRKRALARAKQQRDSEDIRAAGRWENEEDR